MLLSSLLSTSSYTQAEVNTISGSLQTNIDSIVSDDVYSSAWNEVTDVAPSKNAVYDIFGSGGETDTTLSGTPKVFTIKDLEGTPYYFKAYPHKA
jgi:hypothetical protein